MATLNSNKINVAFVNNCVIINSIAPPRYVYTQGRPSGESFWIVWPFGGLKLVSLEINYLNHLVPRVGIRGYSNMRIHDVDLD